MKQFDVNLLWCQIRQTLRAPVARRRHAARFPALLQHQDVGPPGPQRTIRAHRLPCHRQCTLLPVRGKLRNRDPSDPEPGDGPRFCSASACPRRPGRFLGRAQWTTRSPPSEGYRRSLGRGCSQPASPRPAQISSILRPSGAAAGTSQRLQGAASAAGSARPSARKFRSSGDRSAANPMRGFLPPVPRRPSTPALSLT